MAATFPLRVVTPTGIVFEDEVEQVTARNPIGEFGVLAQHINFVTSLVPCVLRIRIRGAETENWIISGGLAEVKDGAMTILADSAESPASVNRAAAESEVRDKQEKLGSMSAFEVDFVVVESELALVRARIEAVEVSS